MSKCALSEHGEYAGEGGGGCLSTSSLIYIENDPVIQIIVCYTYMYAMCNVFFISNVAVTLLDKHPKY